MRAAGILLGAAVCAQAGGPQAFDQTAQAAVLSQRFFIHLSFDNPGGSGPSFHLVNPPAGVLEVGAAGQQGSYQSIAPGEPVSSALWYYSTDALEPGQDAFTWYLVEGSATSTVATATIQLLANTPPVAHDQSAGLVQGTRANLALSFTDPDTAQPFAFRLDEPPAHGLLEYQSNRVFHPVPAGEFVASSAWRYTPGPGHVGADVFQWSVTDGVATSQTAAFTVHVLSNTPPAAYTLRAVCPPGGSASRTARFSDPDAGQTHTLLIVQGPMHGSLGVSGRTMTYTPNPGFLGEDRVVFRIHDGVDDSDDALFRIQVRESGDRAGNLVLLAVRETLYPNLSNGVVRLRQDLADEGYVSRVQMVPSTATTTSLWAQLKAEYDDPDQWLEGAILIGNLPRPQAFSYHAYYQESRWFYNDLVYWNLNFLQSSNAVATADLCVWVSRLYATGSPYGTEVELLKRALDANHAARRGQSRLPHDAYFYHAWENRAHLGTNLLQVWPSVVVTNEVGANSDLKSNARFLPWRADLPHAGADALVAGGDLFQETSHGNANAYMYLAFNRDHLFRLVSQQRACMIESCTSGAFGGIANHHILTRGGSTVFSVSGTDVNYVGDFQVAGTPASAAGLRARLAEGEAWGSALLRHYAFGALTRTVYYGDLSIPARVAPTNTVPVIASFTSDTAHVLPGQPVTFSIQVSDPYAEQADNPDSPFKHRVEWFLQGYNGGRNEPTLVTDTAQNPDWTQATHVFSQTGTYAVRAEVTDEWRARGWKEMTVTVHPYDMAVAPASPASPHFLNAGETARFSVTPYHALGTNGLAYAWMLDGRPIAGSGPGLEWTAPAGFSGRYRLEVTVSDPWGSNVSHAWDIDVSGAPPPAGPVGYWRLDEEAGDRADSSGFGNHLASHGGVGFAAGLAGGAARFSGGDFLARAAALQQHLDPRDAFTVSAWVYPESLNGVIFSRFDDGAAQRAFRVRLLNGRVRAHFSADGAAESFAEGTRTHGTGAWHHVALVFEQGSVRFYTNGALNVTRSVPVTALFPAPDALFGLGASFRNQAIRDPFAGRIDEARIFLRALSSSEIAALTATGNLPPFALADRATTRAGQPVWIDVLANDGDPDGDPPTLTGAGPGSHGGTVSLHEGGVLYSPADGFEGEEIFPYTIADLHGAAATGTVSVLVLGEVPVQPEPPAGTPGIGFRFQLAAGWKYIVEYADDLLVAGPWMELTRGVSGPAAWIEIEDPNPADRRFYRIRVRP